MTNHRRIAKHTIQLGTDGIKHIVPIDNSPITYNDVGQINQRALGMPVPKATCDECGQLATRALTDSYSSITLHFCHKHKEEVAHHLLSEIYSTQDLINLEDLPPFEDHKIK